MFYTRTAIYKGFSINIIGLSGSGITEAVYENRHELEQDDVFGNKKYFNTMEYSNSDMEKNTAYFYTYVSYKMYFTFVSFVVLLTLWRRNYFFLILAHPVYKM